MSSGVPARRTGVRAATASMLGRSPRASARRDHRRVDEPGRDRVHGDAVRRVLDRQRLREPDDAALRRDVVRHARRARLRARRRDRHDPAPARGEHVGDRGLQAVERAGEVDREHALPRVERDVGERLELVEPALVTMISIGPSSPRTFAIASSTAGAVGDVDRDAERAPRRAPQRPRPRRPAASPSRSSSATRCPRAARRRATAEAHARCGAGDHGDPAHRAPSSDVRRR